VLIAFAILAVALGAILQAFSQGLRTMSLAERHTQAALLAQSKLAEVGATIPLEEGEQTGETGQGYEWRVDIRTYEGPDAPFGGDDAVRLFQVDVEVAWEGGTPARLVTLRSAVGTP
jgi:general secretion pathway protein I